MLTLVELRAPRLFQSPFSLCELFLSPFIYKCQLFFFFLPRFGLVLFWFKTDQRVVDLYVTLFLSLIL